jgi:hypothetical protein
MSAEKVKLPRWPPGPQEGKKKDDAGKQGGGGGAAAAAEDSSPMTGGRPIGLGDFLQARHSLGGGGAGARFAHRGCGDGDDAGDSNGGSRKCTVAGCTKSTAAAAASGTGTAGACAALSALHLQQQQHRAWMSDAAASSRCGAAGCRRWAAPGGAFCVEHGEKERAAPSVLDGPPGSMDADPRWVTMLGVVRENDHRGVVFVRTAVGVYVIKSTATAAELFGAELARALDLAAPRVRPLFAADVERRALVAGFDAMRARLLVDGAPIDGGAMGLFEVNEGAPVLLVLEMLPQLQVLAGMAPAAAEALFSAAAAGGAGRLAALGRLLALDLFLNNGDRVPCPVWDNEGNGGNVAVTRDGVLVAIDTSASGIDGRCGPVSAERLRLYLQRMGTFLAAVFSGHDAAVAAAMQGARGFILRESGGFDIGVKGCAVIAGGVREGVARILALPAEDVLALRTRVADAMPVAQASRQDLDCWRDSVRCIDLEFFEQVRGVFRSSAAGAGVGQSGEGAPPPPPPPPPPPAPEPEPAPAQVEELNCG